MGAYGHSRLREFVLGGATRSMLSNPPLPISAFRTRECQGGSEKSNSPSIPKDLAAGKVYGLGFACGSKRGSPSNAILVSSTLP